VVGLGLQRDVVIEKRLINFIIKLFDTSTLNRTALFLFCFIIDQMLCRGYFALIYMLID